jgi:L-fuconolactonase
VSQVGRPAPTLRGTREEALTDKTKVMMTTPSSKKAGRDACSVDSHVHVWGNDPVRYPHALPDGVALPECGSATVADFFHDSSTAPEHPRQALLIQPKIYGRDHGYLFDTVTRSPKNGVRVMPLINPTGPTSVAEVRRLVEHEGTAGARVCALGPGPAEWLCWPESNRVWEMLSELQLPVGFLVDPPQLPLIAKIANAYPSLVVVLDHLARCSPALQARWMPALLLLAVHPQVHVKLSAFGALSEQKFPFADMWPLTARLYDEYGPDRLLWGSDWPHGKAYGPYDTTAAALRIVLEAVPPRDVEAIMGRTAARLFQFR